jgi:hypothetical protein
MRKTAGKVIRDKNLGVHPSTRSLKSVFVTVYAASPALIDGRRGAMAESRKKILCIEDDRETVELIVEGLAHRGSGVIVAYGGHDGFVAILKHRPDLSITA